MANDEDEVTIDFSKITGFFKPKPSKKEDVSEKQSNDEEDSEVSIDFSAVKGWFKSLLKTEKSEEGVDISKATAFISKYKTVVLLLIPVILSIYIRMMATQSGYTDEWAYNYVYGNVKSSVAAQINQQYPNLPSATKDSLVNEQLAKLWAQQQPQIKPQIQQISTQIKGFFQDPDGHLYMPDIDPYYWYRYANNILDHGSPGDVLVNGLAFDNHMYSPLGRFISKADMFHPEFLANLQRVMSIFDGKIQLMQSMQYYPVIIMALTTAIIFFIARRVTNDVGGFFAATMAAIIPSLLSRTLYGHADTDAFVVFFPVLIAFLFLEAFEAKKRSIQILLSVLSGFAIGVYSGAWGGWLHIYVLVMGTLAATLAYLVIIHHKEFLRNPVHSLSNPAVLEIFIVAIAILVSAGISVTFFRDAQTFIYEPLGIFGFSAIKAPVLSDLWPNTLTTVAELNDGSFDGVVASVGGSLLFYIALAGILFSMVRTEKHGKRDVKAALLLILWFIATTYAGIKGIRFTILLIPAFCIAFGVFAGFVYVNLVDLAAKSLRVNRLVSSVIMLLLLGSLFLFPSNIYAQAQSIASHDVPLINDAWYNALINIKNNSTKNAIITSWWDFGHHFKALADRPVTFDGTTQDTPMAHWVGKALQTNDEATALGILRMLDCGSTKAFDSAMQVTNDTHKTWDLMYLLFVQDRQSARQILLKNGFTGAQANDVLQYTHCEPPEGFFITSEDMVGKAGVWAHFGLWDFQKAWIYRFGRGLAKEAAVAHMMSDFNITSQEAESLYYAAQSLTTDQEGNNWVSPWPGYVSQGSCEDRSNGTYYCTNNLGNNQQIGITVDLKTHDATFQAQSEVSRPHSLVVVTPGGVKEFAYDGATIPYSLILVPQGTSYSSVLSSPELAMSTFTRLFYLQGQGLKNFKLFDHQSGLTGTNIYVWKIDWNGTTPNVVPGLVIETAKVDYVGWLENGTVFDSSIDGWRDLNITNGSRFSDYNNTPFSFQVGAGKAIAGFDEAVALMKVNETKVIRIPPDKAYGTDPSQPLGNKTLYFKVQLLSLT